MMLQFPKILSLKSQSSSTQAQRLNRNLIKILNIRLFIKIMTLRIPFKIEDHINNLVNLLNNNKLISKQKCVRILVK